MYTRYLKYFIISSMLLVVSIFYRNISIYKDAKVSKNNQSLPATTTSTNNLSTSTSIKKIAEIDKQPQKYIPKKDEEWILKIPIKSIPFDLVIKKEDWMKDPQRYDKELSDLEKNEKDSQSKQRWDIIIASPDFSVATIKNIKNESIPFFSNKLQFFKAYNEQYTNLIIPIEERYADQASMSSTVKIIYAYSKDMVSITNDLINLTQLQLTIKAKTIEGIKSQDANKASMAAGDEDMVSLVMSWHEERLKELLDTKPVF